MTLGEVVESQRLDAGLSLHSAAEKAGVSIGMWSMTERDLTSPTFRTLMKMAYALQMTVAELVAGVDEESTRLVSSQYDEIQAPRARGRKAKKKSK